MNIADNFPDIAKRMSPATPEPCNEPCPCPCNEPCRFAVDAMKSVGLFDDPPPSTVGKYVAIFEELGRQWALNGSTQCCSVAAAAESGPIRKECL
jgi:hypothetical protein